MSRKLTHEEFIQRLAGINKDIEVLGTYVNCKTKIKCRCRIDGYEWEVIPNSLLTGVGCPECFNNNKRGKARQLTHEEFMQKFTANNEKANNIIILNNYEKYDIPMRCKCKVCGNEWSMRAQNLLNGQGCPKCGIKTRAEKITKTHEQFMQEFKIRNTHTQDIEILGQYINLMTKIKCKCKICGNIWEVIPNGLLSRNYGCPKCATKQGKEKRTKTHEQFIKELKNINPNIKILGQYKNGHTKIKCKCKICGHEWSTEPWVLISGHGCPKCNISKGEQRVAQYLEDNNIRYISQYTFDGCRFKLPLPFDFYLPQYNICIEYDGAFHYKIIKNLGGVDGLIDTKIRDTVKNIYCENNNITLIRIAYWDYDNIEQILDAVLKQEQAI